jgi:negative regulator of flagellin synthesis FlgM
MTDPIRGLPGSSPADGINPATGTKPGHGTAATTPGSGGQGAAADSVDVADTRSLLQTINDAAAAVPTVDQNRVDALRQAIRNGTYRVDPQAVAKGLLNSETALPSSVIKE